VVLFAMAQVNILLDYIVVLTFAHVCQLVGTMFITFTVIIFLRFDQVNGLLLLQSQKSTSLSLKTEESAKWPLLTAKTTVCELFYSLHSQTCLLVFQINAAFSRLMLFFVGFMNPLSAYIVMSVI